MKPYIITTCKGRLHHLKETLPLVLSRTKADVVLVDASCPDGSGDWAMTLHNPKLTVLSKELPYWNAPIVRNAGAKLAIKNGATHLIFLDADTIVQEGFWEALVGRLDQDTFFFTPPLVTDLMGFLAVHSARFIQVGGYDSKFGEYGHEDLDLRLRLYLKTGRFGNIEANLLSTIPHEDSLRTQYLNSKLPKDEQVKKTVQLLHRKYHSLTGTSLIEKSKNSSVYRNLLGVVTKPERTTP